RKCASGRFVGAATEVAGRCAIRRVLCRAGEGFYRQAGLDVTILPGPPDITPSDAGMKPSDLVVFRYDDQGVSVLEDGIYVLQPALADPTKLETLARFLRTSMGGWRYAMAPEHEAEVVAIVLRNASPGMTDMPHQQRMLREVVRLIPGGHGLG